jgi:hypothetical protein
MATAPSDAVSAPSPASDTSEEDAGQPAVTVEVAEVRADDIPVVHTPPGGWTEMPPPALVTCTEPLVAGAVDMRGSWKVVRVDVNGVDDPNHKIMGEEQRIEQCGNRVIITSGGSEVFLVPGLSHPKIQDIQHAVRSAPAAPLATKTGRLRPDARLIG